MEHTTTEANLIEKPSFGTKLIGFTKETIHTIITALLLTFFIYYFIATPNQVKGQSMEPNVHPDELILTNRFKHLLSDTGIGQDLNLEYKRSEMVIFKLPGREAYIKRIIGLPGDKVKVENEKIYINGKQLKEEYIPDGVPTRPGSFAREGITIEVPEGSFFMMGDNRTNSLDSRFKEIGFVKREFIIGPAAFRILPLNRFGVIPEGEFNLKSD